MPASDYRGYNHIHWWVGNAKQAASHYVIRFGFELVAIKSLETGSRMIASHVVRNANVTFVLSSPLIGSAGGDCDGGHKEEQELVRRMHEHYAKHGDAVKEIAFDVDSVDALYDAAIAGGAEAASAPDNISDEDGSVRIAKVRAYGDTVYTLLENHSYSGPFLPGYQPPPPTVANPLSTLLPSICFSTIDHVVGNQEKSGMAPVCETYIRALGFQRFWCVDESDIYSEYSSMRTTVMANASETIKEPINEPAPGKKQSQVSEYIKFNGGPGVQHIALLTEDIVATVSALRARGVEFIEVPETYYAMLREKLAKRKESSWCLQEKLDGLQQLKVLVDFDENGYLLQIFTKHLMDRPTVFLEIIQRYNFNGFGVANVKALFEAFEREQEQRGNC